METSAVIYLRLSALDDREGDNRSLGAEKRECRTWAGREGLITRSAIWEKENPSLSLQQVGVSTGSQSNLKVLVGLAECLICDAEVAPNSPWENLAQR